MSGNKEDTTSDVFLASNNKTGYSEATKKRFHLFRKKKTEHIYIAVLGLIIVILLLVITGLSVGLYIANTTSTSEVTETKCQKSDPCEDGWIWYRGKCYYFSTKDDTWTNSERLCNSHNASLAIINNKKELKFLYRYKGKENHWIGLRRTEDNTAWTWINGKLYNESLFTISRAIQNNIEYAFLNSHDVRSHGQTPGYHYICEKM